MNAAATVQPGTAFGPYTLLRELGRGGMGTVYLAEVRAVPGDKSDSAGPVPAAAAALPPGTRVAVKTFHPHLISSGDFARRFRREARIGASIQHENVVRTLDAGTADLAGTETHYLAMELVEGQTLRELMREMGRVPEELARAVARQAAAGLDAIHRAGITHRDLKPENVILTPDHRVKLMDLGVAKVREESIRLSLTGQFLGSVHYASPEQFRSPDTVDPRSDLYALGVLLHEMIEGRNPFFHEDLSVVLRKTLTELPRRLSVVVPETSAVLDQLVASLLAKDPAERPASAAEAADALERGEESDWWTTRGRRLWSQVAARVACRMPVAREVPFVGHEEDFGALRREFDLAAAGARRVVLLEGEAGIGKTRLADEFAASLAEEGVRFRFTFGVAPARGTGRPYHVFADALQRALGAEDPAAALAALLPAGTQAAELAALVAGAPGEEMPVERARTLFAAAFRALAADEPLVVVLDDLQNAGPDSATLLAYLIHDDPATPLLLVASYRPPDESVPLHRVVQGGREENVVTVRVGPLGAREVGVFLRNVLKSERAVQELGFRLLERTEGNPHFLIEVLRSLQDEHVLKRRDDGGWTMASTRVEIHVPDSVRELVGTQLAAVGEEEREILDVAAVAGAEFDPEVVAEVLGHPRIAVLKRLSALERKHRLIRAAGRRCRFEHPQLRETIYDALLEGLREEYHAQVAEALAKRRTAGAPDDGAGHFEQFRHLVLGGRPDAARPHALPALDFAAKRLRADEGADLARRFLALVAASASSDDAAPMPSAADNPAPTPTPSAADVSSAALHANVRLRLAGFLDHEGSRGEERAVLDAALTDARTTGDAALVGRVLDRRFVLFLAQGDFAAAEASCREAFRLASRRKDRDAALAALVNLAAALRCQGRYDAAAAALRRALRYVIHEQSRLRRTILLSSLALVESQRGRRRTAQRHYLEATAMAQDFGIARAGDAADSQPSDGDELRDRFLGLSRALGRSAEARVDGERAILLGGAAPRRVREGGALAALAGVATHLGFHEDARGLLHGALCAVREGGDLRAEAAVLQALGENASERRAPEAARRRLVAALELRRRIGHRPGVCETLLALGQLAALGGSVEAARPYLEEATELAPALEMPAIAALSRATSALLHAREGRAERARAELEEARMALGDPGPLSVASRVEGLWFASLAARALGDAPSADQHVARAWDILRQVAGAMDADQRRAFLLETSPHREIVEAVGAKV